MKSIALMGFIGTALVGFMMVPLVRFCLVLQENLSGRNADRPFSPD